MREILFRGKKLDDGKWVQGYCYEVEKDRMMISSCIKREAYEVNPETIGQYTGVEDCTGRKIFEGDIVKCTDEINGLEFTALVQFGNPNSEYSWGYQLVFIAGDEANLDILCWVEMEETGAYIEVIGNIYDNPELLIKGEQLCFF